MSNPAVTPPRAPIVTVSPAHAQSGARTPATNAALQLLQFEADLRRARSLGELRVLVVNGARGLVHCRHVFAVQASLPSGISISAVTELAVVDRSTPLIGWIERVLSRFEKDCGLTAAREFTLRSYSTASDDAARMYPLDHALWMPLRTFNGAQHGGLLFVRDTPWREADVTIANRIAETTAHAASVFAGPRFDWRELVKNRRRVAAIGAAALLIATFPVSITTLAPFEIMPRAPYVVAAPIDGVIEEILVAPSSEISQGQVLLRLADIVVRNKFAVAEREVAVADAHLKRTMQQAFTDVRGRHEIAIAQAELKLKRAERDFARDMLGRSQLKAPHGGIVVFGDARDLIGKPVQTGEKIMEIAEPARVEIRIDAGVSDAALLKPEARVKVFLDSDPMQPHEAKLDRADYQARLREGGNLAFRAVAIFTDGTPPPRLGLRGTAQIYGNTAPLAYYLLRRPIAAARQWVGI